MVVSSTRLVSDLIYGGYEREQSRAAVDGDAQQSSATTALLLRVSNQRPHPLCNIIFLHVIDNGRSAVEQYENR